MDYEREIAKTLATPLHTRLVANRRVSVLARHMSELLPSGSHTGLDIGCGSGEILGLLNEYRPELKLTGAEVIARDDAHIPIVQYDGKSLPFEDGSFDFTMMVDVLHHTDDPEATLKEAVRVSRRFVLIKDHYCENVLDDSVLRFMDWVGNRAHGVHLPFNYLSNARWQDLFPKCGLKMEEVRPHLGLYPFPGSLIFERSLHFAARLALAEG